MTKAVKTIILAAGQGTRLRPLTDKQPKAMVPLMQKPMLERQIEVLFSLGLKDISVITGYCAECISDSRVRKMFNQKYASVNMVASLYCAKSMFDGASDIIVSYGDIVYEPRVLQALLKEESKVAVVVDNNWYKLWQLRMESPLEDAETMKLDKDGNIIELGKKPGSLKDIEGQYIGLFKISRRFAKDFFTLYESLANSQNLFDGRDFDNMYMTTYLQLLINNGVRIKAVRVENGWLEVDSVEDLRRYEKLHASGDLQEICCLD